MNEFEKQQISSAFINCYGMKDTLIKHSDKDSNENESIIHSLSKHSGLRKSFIRKHIKEITAL